MMYIKNLIDEDFVNYKKPSMFIACHSCSFKCDAAAGAKVCQNGELANSPDIEISIEELVRRYLENPISEAVVFGGLEPFDDIANVLDFIQELRKRWNYDDVVIYTGYSKDEIKRIAPYVYEKLSDLSPIIIKYGGFIPNQKPHYDEVLGIMLHSDNQYAEEL